MNTDTVLYFHMRYSLNLAASFIQARMQKEAGCQKFTVDSIASVFQKVDCVIANLRVGTKTPHSLCHTDTAAIRTVNISIYAAKLTKVF